MTSQWEIKEYVKSSGISPVKQFLSSLTPSARSKSSRMINTLARYGYMMGMPYSKQLDNNLYELRVRGKQEVRIFYCFAKSSIVLLHAFLKKTQKTPTRELKIAIRRQSSLS